MDYIIEQLNNSCMENSYPIYPRNPFTRKPFSVRSLGVLKKKLIELDKEVQVCLKILLNQSNYMLKKLYGECNESTEDGFNQKLVDLFSKNLRYKRDPAKNSQNLFTGYWVKKDHPKDLFEELYDIWYEMPYQTFFHGTVINSPYKSKIKDLLDSKFNDEKKVYDLEKL